MKKVFLILLAIQVICIGGFLYAVYSADAAMNKAGIGNLQTWDRWNSIAGFIFCGGAAIWICCIIVGIFRKQFNTLAVQLAIGVPLLVFLVSYIGYLLIG